MTKPDDTLQQGEVLRVSFYDGKYTIIQLSGGGMKFLRHGEPWEAADRDFAHVGMILAAAQEIDHLRKGATLWEKIKELCGHWRDGSCETITLGWDDATHTAFLKAGKKRYGGGSLEDAVKQASS